MGLILLPKSLSQKEVFLFSFNACRQYAHSSTYYPPSERCYYDVLGVSKEATASEIKAAFYSKSKMLHPDKAGDNKSTAEFVELKKAYDTLRRPADRRMYDLRDSMPPPRDPRMYHHNPYSSYYNSGAQSGYSGDWRRYWNDDFGANFNAHKMSQSEYKKKSDEYWRSILKWTALGSVLVVVYNGGYFLQLRQHEKFLASLIDEDEIAQSFLRQREFKDKEFDNLEMRNLAQILKSDVDEAWRRRCEQRQLEGRNSNEIREEARWFKVIREDPSHRKVAEARAARRRELAELERTRREQREADEAFLYNELETD